MNHGAGCWVLQEFPAIYLSGSLFVIPESPRFLIKIGKTAIARAILEKN